jgi:hypothetical protein
MAGTSKKQIHDIPTEEIREDTLTRFSMDPPPDALLQSINALGITHPVLLAPASKGYQIVCGHRRVECVRLLGFVSVPAFVLAEAPAPEALLKRNLIENRAHRTYSDIEKGGIVLKLAEAGIPEAEIIKDYLPLLDLERSKKLFVDLQKCASFSQSLKTLLHSLNLPLRVFSILFRWDEDSRAAAESLFGTLRPLNNADLPINQKYDAIHQQLRLWRYPVLTDLQKQVYRAIDQLKLDGRIKLRTPENFESNQFKIELNFSSREELTAQVEQLFRATDAEALDELIRIFRDMK